MLNGTEINLWLKKTENVWSELSLSVRDTKWSYLVDGLNVIGTETCL